MIIGNASGGRRSLDAEVNLVPFIDLLSMCICFLLMTAVWIQIGAVEVKQSRGTEVAPATGAFDMDLRYTGPHSLQLSITKGGKTVKKGELKGDSTAALLATVDAQLGEWARTLGPSGGNLTLGGLVSAALVTPRIGVPYGDLVSLMDLLRRHQIVNLGVVPAGGHG